MNLYLIMYASDTGGRSIYGGYDPELFTSIKKAENRCHELNSNGRDCTYYFMEVNAKKVVDTIKVAYPPHP